MFIKVNPTGVDSVVKVIRKVKDSGTDHVESLDHTGDGAGCTILLSASNLVFLRAYY